MTSDTSLFQCFLRFCSYSVLMLVAGGLFVFLLLQSWLMLYEILLVIFEGVGGSMGGKGVWGKVCFWKVGWFTIIFSVLVIYIFHLESCSDVLDESVCVNFLLMSQGRFIFMNILCLILMIVCVPVGGKDDECEGLENK